MERKRIIHGAHRGGRTDWAMVEVAAFLNEQMDELGQALLGSGVADACLKAFEQRPSVIEQIARVRTER